MVGIVKQVGIALLCAAGALGWAFARADGKESRAENRMQPKTSKMRVAAAQPRNRTLDWKISDPAEVLRHVDRSLEELEQIVHKAGGLPPGPRSSSQGCGCA